jgi:hypothetical protein
VMNTTFDPRTAALLAQRALSIQSSAAELAGLGEYDPVLAGECGVEVCSLEARTILSSGAPRRVAASAQEAAQTGRPAMIVTADLEALSRLEGVVALGSSRIGFHLASLDAAAAQEPTARLGNLVGLASGAIGLIRSFF